MKLAFKEDIHAFEPAVTDPRRTHVDDTKPVTLREPIKSIKPAANYASATLGFFLVVIAAGLALADLSFEIWGLDKETYNMARLLIFVFVVLLALLDAFHNSPIFGFLSLFPPFLVYYGLVMADSTVLRGMIYGLVVWFGFEVLIIPDHSFMSAAARASNGIIEGGHRWLSTANR